MQKTRVVDLDQLLTLTAADLSLNHRLAMADAIVYATAVCNGVDAVATETSVESLPGATVFRRR